MKVVVLAAGQSQRFKEQGINTPKYLLNLNGRPMIQHVLEMFDPADEFFIIINSLDTESRPQLITDLTKLAKNCKVLVLKNPTGGPVESALKANIEFSANEPVIITYCDFYVTWNYRRFLREVEEFDGSIPAFCGFHPASFGNTNYCYLKQNEKSELTALSEKKPLTSQKLLEPASAGIYYFKKWKDFTEYGNLYLRNPSLWQNLPELYVSVLFTKMITDGLRVNVFNVEHFICWGTPEDVEQYNYWSKFFLETPAKPAPVSAHQSNLIPMAGQGERFKKAGYRVSKAFVQVSGLPMVQLACNSFPNAQQWIFVMQNEDLRKYPVQDTFQNGFANPIVLGIEGITSGQAATCLAAENEIPPEHSVFIASCDYMTRYQQDSWQHLTEDQKLDGAIWTFRLKNLPVKNHNNFAYCRVDANGFVSEIVEKRTISNNPGNDHFVVGSFWFRKASEFFSLAQKIVSENNMVNGEHYIGNGINMLLKQNKKFKVFEIDQWISFGDPLELDIYFYWESFFEGKLREGT